MAARRLAACVAILAAAVVSGPPSHAQVVARDKIEDAIREGCERIMKTQRADGAFVLDNKRFTEPATSSTYNVGVVSLGVLALQHALPHLKGEAAVRAREAVGKGLAWLAQHDLEPKTYSAGLIISVIYKEHPSKYRKLLEQYAWMLAVSQHDRKGHDFGYWGYNLHLPPKRRSRQTVAERRRTLGRGDHSNTQFAVLGLLFADRAGFQVPKKVWERLRKHYIEFQLDDGGWAYGPTYSKKVSYANMTLACTISLAICEEMLFAESRRQCKPPPRSGPVQRGLEWVSKNLDYDALETYGFYAVERLGILSGRSEFGGKPWFDEGASRLVKNRRWRAHGAHDTRQQVGAAFAVLFLSRGLEPVIINKLERRGTNDWNNDPYDVKHLVEYISSRFQKPKQWRIVSLKSDVDFLLRVPILYINGHHALDFNAEEKAKLKEYVERGGTIFGMACCGKKPFDVSFRALVAELWPEAPFEALAKTHPIYSNPRPLLSRPKLLGLHLGGGQGRLGVIYSPYDFCCRWHKGGTRAKPAFDVGTNLFFYVDKIASRHVARKE